MLYVKHDAENGMCDIMVSQVDHLGSYSVLYILCDIDATLNSPPPIIIIISLNTQVSTSSSKLPRFISKKNPYMHCMVCICTMLNCWKEGTYVGSQFQIL